MSGGDEITLEGQAVEEILKETKRSKTLAKDFGALAWQKRDVLPNKRFLNNTLVSTLKHGYRTEQKLRDGSFRKYRAHMNNWHGGERYHYKNVGDKGIYQEESPEPECKDYGEFDAIKYSQECTDLYIRDSHRKHARILQNFVEKTGQESSSDSDESYTEYDNEADTNLKHDRFKNVWSDTGSADECTHNEGRNTDDNASYYHNKKHCSTGEKRQKLSRNGYKGKIDEYYKRHHKEHSSSRSDFAMENVIVEKSNETNRNKKEHRSHSTFSKPGTSKDNRSVHSVSPTKDARKQENCEMQNEEMNNDSDKSYESTLEHDDRQNVRKKGKKIRKLPIKDGRDLLQIISERSMYADIEEMKIDEKDQTFVEVVNDRRTIKRTCYDRSSDRIVREFQTKKRINRDHKDKLPDRIREETRSGERSEEGFNEDEKIRAHQHSRQNCYEDERRDKSWRHEDLKDEKEHRFDDKISLDILEQLRIEQKEYLRKLAFEYFSSLNMHSQRPRRRPFQRGRPFMRGWPPRGQMHFRGGIPIFAPSNPFYASYFNEIIPHQLEPFQMHNARSRNFRPDTAVVEKSRSRSRSHSHSRRSHRSRKKRHHSSHSDRSHTRDSSRSGSRSRRHLSHDSYKDRHSRSNSKHSPSHSRYSRNHSRYSRSQSRHSRSRSNHSRRSSTHSKKHYVSHSRDRSKSSHSYSSLSRSQSQSRRDDSKDRIRKRSHSHNSRKQSYSKSRSRSGSCSDSRYKKRHRRSHKKSKHRKCSKSNHRSKSTDSDKSLKCSSDNDVHAKVPHVKVEDTKKVSNKNVCSKTEISDGNEKLDSDVDVAEENEKGEVDVDKEIAEIGDLSDSENNTGGSDWSKSEYDV